MMRPLALVASTLIGAVSAFTGVAVAATSGCAQLGGNVQSGNICHARAETPNYVIDLRFNTDYPDDQPVTDYLVQTRDRVINAAQAPGAKAGDLPCMMTLTSETYRSGQPTRIMPEYGRPWHGTQSLVLKTFLSTGGPSAGTKYKSFTFDFDQNRPVTFDNLFAPGSNPMDSIYPAVATEIARQQVMRHFQLSPKVGRNPALYQNFAITDETVIFFFDTGELMADEAGYFFAPVARANLPPLQL
jgi:Protein of unknown function (DUF3298)